MVGGSGVSCEVLLTVTGVSRTGLKGEEERACVGTLLCGPRAHPIPTRHGSGFHTCIVLRPVQESVSRSSRFCVKMVNGGPGTQMVIRASWDTHL